MLSCFEVTASKPKWLLIVVRVLVHFSLVRYEFHWESTSSNIGEHFTEFFSLNKRDNFRNKKSFYLTNLTLKWASLYFFGKKILSEMFSQSNAVQWIISRTCITLLNFQMNKIGYSLFYKDGMRRNATSNQIFVGVALNLDFFDKKPKLIL